jgi:DNA polymerase III delta subunit
LVSYLSEKKIGSAIEVLNYYEKNEPGIIPLLIWLFNRDIQAINMILTKNGSPKKLGIWDSQLNSYNKIAKRFTKKKIESALFLLDESDKKFKGFLRGNPWDSLREVMFEFI